MAMQSHDHATRLLYRSIWMHTIVTPVATDTKRSATQSGQSFARTDAMTSNRGSYGRLVGGWAEGVWWDGHLAP